MTVDSGTAKAQHFKLGDQVTVITNQPPRRFTVVGITGFGKADNLAGATLVTFDPATAQQLFGRPGYFDEIDISAGRAPTPISSSARSAPRLPHGFEALSGAAVAQETAKTVEQGFGFLNTFLLTFAFIALFVGGFLIFNTFSILVGQRTRELALLRAIGASRSQVNRSVMAEALVVGFGGSVLGLLVGVPLAAGLYAALGALGADLPSSALQLLPRTVIVSLLTGTVITLVSAILPARRASRIAPVAAMRDDAGEAETSLRRRAIIGGCVLAVGVLLLASGLFAHAGIAAVGAGAAISFVGVAVLAPFVAGPLARTLGSPLPKIEGVTGRMAQQNAARNPRRTAATASALMVGLAVVAAIATLAASATASFNGLFDQAIKADYVITGQRPERVFARGRDRRSARPPASSRPARCASPTSTTATPPGRSPASTRSTGPRCSPSTMKSGSPAALSQGQVLIDDKTAKSRHFRVGDVLNMGFGATGVKPFVIGGTYKTNQFFGNYTLSAQVGRRQRQPGHRHRHRPQDRSPDRRPTGRTGERGQGLPQHQRQDRGAVQDGPEETARQHPRHRLRAAGAEHHHRPDRGGQHPRPVGHGADPGDRLVAGGRHAAPADQAHGSG